jgi:hypothetical protein
MSTLWSHNQVLSMLCKDPGFKFLPTTLHVLGWRIEWRGSSFFSDVKQQWLVASYHCFGTAYWSHLLDPWRRDLCCPETSETNYHSTLCNIPQGQRPHLQWGRGPKSCDLSGHSVLSASRCTSTIVDHSHQRVKEQDCKWCTQQHSTQTSPSCFLLSKCHMASQDKHKCNFFRTYMKVPPSLSEFSQQNLQVLSSIMCRSVMQNFTQIENKCGKYRQKFPYALVSKMVLTEMIPTKLTIES